MRKIFYVIVPLITTVYSLLYASLGGFIGNKSAMSKIGLEHPILFAIWGLITLLCLSGQLIIGYRKTKYKIHIPLLTLAAIGMLLTIIFDFDYDKHTQYILHCIGSLAFSIIMGVAVFLLFILSKNYILAGVSGVVLLTDLTLLLIYKETAFIELMPIFSGYILLTIHNLGKENESVEIK